jgi:hypothetical protein
MEDNKVNPNLLGEKTGQTPNTSVTGNQLKTINFHMNNVENGDTFSDTEN